MIFFDIPRFVVHFAAIAGLVVKTLSRASPNSRSLTLLSYTRSGQLIPPRLLQMPSWLHVVRASLAPMLSLTILVDQSTIAIPGRLYSTFLMSNDLANQKVA
jgi:hypothetical protein